MTTETVPCPTCGGSGKVYQEDGYLGGQVYSEKDKPRHYTMQHTCGTCKGSGQVPK